MFSKNWMALALGALSKEQDVNFLRPHKFLQISLSAAEIDVRFEKEAAVLSQQRKTTIQKNHFPRARAANHGHAFHHTRSACKSRGIHARPQRHRTRSERTRTAPLRERRKVFAF